MSFMLWEAWRHRSVRVMADSQQGGRFICCLLKFDLCLSLLLAMPHTHINMNCMYTYTHRLAVGKSLKAGGEKASICLALNYSICDQLEFGLTEAGLGEFLCCSGLQLIVFVSSLPRKMSRRGKAQRGPGCLNILCGSKLLKLLSNINQRYSSADGQRAATVNFHGLILFFWPEQKENYLSLIFFWASFNQQFWDSLKMTAWMKCLHYRKRQCVLKFCSFMMEHIKRFVKL